MIVYFNQQKYLLSTVRQTEISIFLKSKSLGIKYFLGKLEKYLDHAIRN